MTEVVVRYAHHTDRVNESLSSTGFALGGRPGAKAATKLILQTGADSILRRMRDAAARPPYEIKVRTLGVDDWALKKGQVYGTILVDLEKRLRVLTTFAGAPSLQTSKCKSDVTDLSRRLYHNLPENGSRIAEAKKMAGHAVHAQRTFTIAVTIKSCSMKSS